MSVRLIVQSQALSCDTRNVELKQQQYGFGKFEKKLTALQFE